jgi:hypothetical protein
VPGIGGALPGEPGGWAPAVYPGDYPPPGFVLPFPGVVELPPGTVTVPGAAPYDPTNDPNNPAYIDRDAQTNVPPISEPTDPGFSDEPTPGDNPLIPNPSTEGPPVIIEQPGPPVIFAPGPPGPPGGVSYGGDRIATPGQRYAPIDQGIYGPLRRTRDKIRHHSGWPTWPGYDVGRFPKVAVKRPGDVGGPPGGPGSIFRFPRVPPVFNLPQPKPDDTPDEAPPLPPPDEPANDTSIRRPPVQQVEPVRVPDPAGIRAPFPQPELPQLPGVPPLTPVTPEVPTWPSEASQPVFTPSNALPGAIASPIPASSPSTATQTAPQSQSLVIPILLPLLGLASLIGRGALRSPGLRFSQLTSSVPATIPGLTPANAPGVASQPDIFPQGQTCETPSQTRARRAANRSKCERFIRVRVPAHTKRVCAAEAGRLIGRKLGKALGKKIGHALGLSKSRHVAVRHAGRRNVKKRGGLKISKRGTISYGGFGVGIPKQFRPHFNIGKGIQL